MLNLLNPLAMISGAGASSLGIQRAVRDYAGIRLAENFVEDSQHKLELAECLEFVTDCQNGVARPRHWQKFGVNISEALTSSDFTNLFATSLDRELLGRYTGIEVTWKQWARPRVVTDFRKAQSFFLDGPTGLLQRRGERGEFPEGKLDDGKYEIQVFVYGGNVSLPFETLTNDDLNAFAQIPMDLGDSAVNTEEYLATQLLVDANGPNAEFFNEDNDNLEDMDLNYDNLKSAIKEFMVRKGPNGMPIRVKAISLVVSPERYLDAVELVNAATIELGAMSDAKRLITENPMKQIVTVSRNDFMDIIAEDATKSPWFLTANPGVSRPAFQCGYLRGFEQPGLYMQASDRRTPQGGAVDQRLGNFDTMSNRWQVILIFGKGYGDPKMALASKGGTSGGSGGGGGA